MTAPRSEAERPLRWALLGASGIAEGRVIPAMRAVAQIPVVVLSESAERGAEFAARNGIDRSTTSLDEAVSRPDVDAVFVSATNERHRALAERAAAAGKHVLCEKPLADTLADAKAIVAACAAAGVVLAVNHHLPGAGTISAIRDLVMAGAVGDVLGARIAHLGRLPERYHRWRLGASRGAGVVLDTASHAASALNSVLAPLVPTEVAAMAVTQGAWNAQSEDAAMSVIRYGDRVLAQTYDAYTTPFADAGLEIYGSAGSIVGRGVLTQDPVGQVLLQDATGIREVDVADRTDLYQRVLLEFEAAVAGTGRPTTTGAEGLAALRVADAIRESARSGRVVIL